MENKAAAAANTKHGNFGNSITTLLTPSFRGGAVGTGHYQDSLTPSPSNQMSEFSFAVNSSGFKGKGAGDRRNDVRRYSNMSFTSAQGRLSNLEETN